MNGRLLSTHTADITDILLCQYANTNAPVQAMVNDVLHYVLKVWVFIYLDDFLENKLFVKAEKQ